MNYIQVCLVVPFILSLCLVGRMSAWKTEVSGTPKVAASSLPTTVSTSGCIYKCVDGTCIRYPFYPCPNGCSYGEWKCGFRCSSFKCESSTNAKPTRPTIKVKHNYSSRGSSNYSYHFGWIFVFPAFAVPCYLIRRRYRRRVVVYARRPDNLEADCPPPNDPPQPPPYCIEPPPYSQVTTEPSDNTFGFPDFNDTVILVPPDDEANK